jgi:hypothetical protein
MLEILLALVPLFLLVTALLLGHYPGVEAIVRLSARIGARRRARPTQSQARPKLRPRCAPAAGLLIALGMAQRPPPLPS